MLACELSRLLAADGERSEVRDVRTIITSHNIKNAVTAITRIVLPFITSQRNFSPRLRRSGMLFNQELMRAK